MYICVCVPQDNELVIVLEWAEAGDLAHVLKAHAESRQLFSVEQVMTQFYQVRRARARRGRGGVRAWGGTRHDGASSGEAPSCAGKLAACTTRLALQAAREGSTAAGRAAWS